MHRLLNPLRRLLGFLAFFSADAAADTDTEDPEIPFVFYRIGVENPLESEGEMLSQRRTQDERKKAALQDIRAALTYAAQVLATDSSLQETIDAQMNP